MVFFLLKADDADLLTLFELLHESGSSFIAKENAKKIFAKLILVS